MTHEPDAPARVAFTSPSTSTIRRSLDTVHAEWQKVQHTAVGTCRHDIDVSPSGTHRVRPLNCSAGQHCAPDVVILDAHGRVQWQGLRDRGYQLRGGRRGVWHQASAVLAALPAPFASRQALVLAGCEGGSRSARQAAEANVQGRPYLASRDTSAVWQGLVLYGVLLRELDKQLPTSPRQWRDTLEHVTAHAEDLTCPVLQSCAGDPFLAWLMRQAGREADLPADLELRQGRWRSWSATLTADA